jgi:hypothetical protein
MRLRNTSIALGTAIAALAAVTAADSAAAATPGYRGVIGYIDGGGFLYRAPQPSQSLPGATSRPSSRDMRGAPSMGGRGMRGMGGSRTNGGMGRR